MLKWAFVIILANAFLAISANRCNKEILHRIIIDLTEICEVQKRSFSSRSDWSKFRSFKFINSDGVERQYQEAIESVAEVFKMFSNMLDRKKIKEVTVVPQRPSRLSIFKEKQTRKTPSKFRLYDDFSTFQTKRNDNLKRDMYDYEQEIEKEILECCVRNCSKIELRDMICDK